MKEARLAIRMPNALLKETKALARRRKTTMNEIVRQLLESEIESDRKKRGITSTFDAEQA